MKELNCKPYVYEDVVNELNKNNVLIDRKKQDFVLKVQDVDFLGHIHKKAYLLRISAEEHLIGRKTRKED